MANERIVGDDGELETPQILESLASIGRSRTEVLSQATVLEKEHKETLRKLRNYLMKDKELYTTLGDEIVISKVPFIKKWDEAEIPRGWCIGADVCFVGVGPENMICLKYSDYCFSKETLESLQDPKATFGYTDHPGETGRCRNLCLFLRTNERSTKGNWDIRFSIHGNLPGDKPHFILRETEPIGFEEGLDMLMAINEQIKESYEDKNQKKSNEVKAMKDFLQGSEGKEKRKQSKRFWQRG